MRILAVTGSTGGHIFPAVSFIYALKNKRQDLSALLVLPDKSLKSGITISDCEVKYIPALAVSSKLNAQSIVSLGRSVKGILKSLKIILEFKPDIVVGFGSINSVPSLFFAWLFRIPTMIHEQNVLPGKANRFLARFADKIAISFSNTKDYWKIGPEKTVLTGNPLRERLRMIDKNSALDSFGLSRDKFTVLVMGGSQGSRRLNAGFLKAVSSLKDAAIIQIIHLAGPGDLEEIKKSYKNMNIDARVFGFYNHMEEAYSASDLVISRSGAATVSELEHFKLPSVLLPYPYAYAHQFENAKVLSAKGCAVIVKDDELDKDTLGVILGSIIRNGDKLKSMRSAFASSSAPKAADLLADAALSLHN